MTSSVPPDHTDRRLQAGESYEAGAQLEEELGIREAEFRFVLKYRYDGPDNPASTRSSRP